MVVLGAISTSPAPASAQLPPVESSSPACTGHRFRLDGAAALPDSSGSATLVPEWLPALETIADCLRRPEHERTCAVVQGRFDEQSFSHAVVTAFGSAQAAQLARARARATAVLSRLSELGVPAERLREAPPLPEPTWRGTEVVLLEGCLPAPQRLSEDDVRLVEEARAVLAAPPQPQVVVQEVAAPASPSPFFVEAGPGGSLELSSSAVAAPSLRAGLGARRGHVTGRVSAAIATASPDERRASWELKAGAGYALLGWLDLGLAGGLRWGSVGLDSPWLDRSWFAGFEAVECPLSLAEGTELCLEQSLFPIGSVHKRARIEDGKLERIPATRDSLVRLELGAFLRQHF
ncbi:hypothetical protein AKJ08_2563 [Vulgatibacter incomptus]|uniref:OmpA-like domain-containing protein n=2 Tax=Vulgatibacter incomptus TaxID=1391653 RepID=A0A0K1PFG6_9BACT|nr:hypothetical protein AKJ08_2563 [Vulgatibacter incomptus]